MGGRDKRRLGLVLAVAYGCAVGIAAETSAARPGPETPPVPEPRPRGKRRLAAGLIVPLIVGAALTAYVGGSEVERNDDVIEVARSRSLAAQLGPAQATPAEIAAAEPAAEDPPTAAEVAIEVAHEQLGKPYRWAGTGPNAFDCSGLTSFVWRAAGVELPRTSRSQFGGLPRVPLEQIRPGDLVYSPGHIGLYIGDGKMIHAPLSGRDVEVAPLHPSAIGAVRPTPTDTPAA